MFCPLRLRIAERPEKIHPVATIGI